MFECPTCKHSMKPLFTTYYCGVCDPRPEPVTAASKKSWTRRMTPQLSKSEWPFEYQLLRKNDKIPDDAVAGFWIERMPNETEDKMVFRAVQSMQGSSIYMKRGGWLLSEYSNRNIPLHNLDDTDYLMVTKPDL